MKEKLFLEKLKLLSEDNISGSNQLLYKLNEIFISEYKNVNLEKSLFDTIRKKFHSFNSIISYVNQLEIITKQYDENEIFEFFKSFSVIQSSKYNRIYKNLVPYLKNSIKIITISNSATILNIMLKVHEEYKIETVTISESRPQCEGREMAKIFSENKINTNFIIEAIIPKYVEESDLCLIGTDKILNSGNVINKIGSNLLAITCKYFNVPYIVLGDKSKFSNENSYSENKKTYSEIWKSPPENITIDNFYFEEIDKELITQIITD